MGVAIGLQPLQWNLQGFQYLPFTEKARVILYYMTQANEQIK